MSPSKLSEHHNLFLTPKGSSVQHHYVHLSFISLEIVQESVRPFHTCGKGAAVTVASS